MLICFEGVDGAGKTTISKMRADKLVGLYCRTPGQGKLGTKMRKILLDKEEKLHCEALPFLFLADMIHCLNQIKVLNNNHVVVIDRWKMSTLVYQVERDWFTDRQKELLKQIINEMIPDPDILIVLDVDNRRYTTKDRYEEEFDEWENRRRLYEEYFLTFKGKKLMLNVTKMGKKEVFNTCMDFLYKHPYFR